jgi:cytochrome c biogenesis protein CcmG/thiol:disulfide interchange protein DsbE
MKQYLLSGLVGLSVLSAAGCAKIDPSAGAKASTATTKPVAERKAAPDFELKDSEGRTVKLSDFKGKVVLLNFWATWCGPCKIEIPWFIEFERAYKDQGLVVLGVATDEEGWEVVKPYITEKQVNYRVVMSSPSVEQLYGGVEALPMSFMVDRQGKIASIHTGLVSKSDYENEIKELLR